MLNLSSPAKPAGRDSDVWLLDMARTPMGAPGGALNEVQPAALLAGLIAALCARNQAGLPLDALVVGAAAQGSVMDTTLACALARAGAPAMAGVTLLEGGSDAGVDAVRLAAAQLRVGESKLALAGAIHLPSRAREQRRPNPDVLGALAAQAVSPRAAADVAAALQGIRAADVVAGVDQLRRAGVPDVPGESVEPVLDINGLTILATDDMGAAGGAPDAAEEPWQAHHALARKVFPQLGEIARIHSPPMDAPALEGACLLLLGRADAAARLGLRARVRIVACARAGHRRLHVLEAAALAFDQALEHAGWSRGQIDLVEACSRFAGMPPALGRALHLEGVQLKAGWWHANAGAVSPVMALARLAGSLERSGQRRGALVCPGDSGSSVVILVERGNDD